MKMNVKYKNMTWKHEHMIRTLLVYDYDAAITHIYIYIYLYLYLFKEASKKE